ncbi:MAG: metal-binding protein [Methanobrevibacter sp.]|mgnify:FL=1|nr:metal-binding protein [Methanobrevibacter sp.]
MSDKIALVSCSGLSPLGLVVRAATVELALGEDNVVAACITEYSAQPNQCNPILKDADVISISGCEDDCTSAILEEKGVNVLKNIPAGELVEKFNLNPNDAVRLDEDGELAVKKLKEVILKELKDL